MVGSKRWQVTALKSRYRIAEAEGVNDICEKLNRAIEAVVSSENLFSDSAPRLAYLTFATPAYHWGLTVWLTSLRKVSDKPAFVLVSREMPLPTDITDVYVVVVPELCNDGSKELAASHRPEFRHVLNELWIFAALAFDRIFYTDVDCLFLKSADELFTRSGFLVCPDYVKMLGADGSNSDVMVFDPDKDLRERIFAQVLVVTSEDRGDQGYLNVILRDEVVFVDEKYNILRHFHDISRNSANNDARIIHYIVKKPWAILFREGADATLIRRARSHGTLSATGLGGICTICVRPSLPAVDRSGRISALLGLGGPQPDAPYAILFAGAILFAALPAMLPVAQPHYWAQALPLVAMLLFESWQRIGRVKLHRTALGGMIIVTLYFAATGPNAPGILATLGLTTIVMLIPVAWGLIALRRH